MRGKKMICTLVFMILSGLNGWILGLGGFDVASWQYWASMVCVWGAYVVGVIHGNTL